MNYHENDYSVLTMHKQREHELITRASNHRLARMKNEVIRRMRRAVRINNN